MKNQSLTDDVPELLRAPKGKPRGRNGGRKPRDHREEGPCPCRGCLRLATLRLISSNECARDWEAELRRQIEKATARQALVQQAQHLTASVPELFQDADGEIPREFVLDKDFLFA